MTTRSTTGAPCQHGLATSEAFGSASPPGTSAADVPGVETGLGAPVVLAPEELRKAGVKRAMADFMRRNQ